MHFLYYTLVLDIILLKIKDNVTFYYKADDGIWTHDNNYEFVFYHWTTSAKIKGHSPLKIKGLSPHRAAPWLKMSSISLSEGKTPIKPLHRALTFASLSSRWEDYTRTCPNCQAKNETFFNFFTERVRFELTEDFTHSDVFKTSVLNRSTISPFVTTPVGVWLFLNCYFFTYEQSGLLPPIKITVWLGSIQITIIIRETP